MGWSTFWDSFKNAVDNRSDFPNSQKLVYIKNLLHADALQLVAGLSSDDESYAVAVKLLQDTYGCKLKGVMHQVEAMLNLKLITVSGQHMIQFRAATENFIGSFKDLGYPIEGNPTFEDFSICLMD